MVGGGADKYITPPLPDKYNTPPLHVLMSRLLAIKRYRAGVGHTEPHRTAQNRTEPHRTVEDDSLKWGELTVFLKFMQTYRGRPPLCVDGHVSVTCVLTAISVWTAISLRRRPSLQTTISADGHLCVDGHLSPQFHQIQVRPNTARR